MWNIQKVAGVTGRLIYNVHRSYRNRPIKRRFGMAMNLIPDVIKYPNGNEKFKNFLDNLKKNQSERNYQNTNILNRILDLYEHRLSMVDEYKELAQEMINETGAELVAMANEEKQRFSELLSNIDDVLIDEIVAMNDDDMDVSSMMLEVQSGVGGQEAMLFARELFEMYDKYIKFKKWDHDVLRERNTDSGGVRCASIVVRGQKSYDILKHEAGVHRVQRVPSTEKGGRIHTSTAVVLIVPCADDIDIKINTKDLRIETKRSSAPGGQNVNKLESAVRIVHIPTGIAVECQEERTQHKNKQIAMRKLYNQLYQIEFNKQVSNERLTRKSQIGLRTRNEKLRTYNYPQNRITDHRINGAAGTMHNLDEFLAGTYYFNDFIENINQLIKRQKLVDILDKY